MSYGLFDGDLVLYPQIPFFNLELMKLSTYYKQKREIVSFTPKFVPNMYSHFLIRQDYAFPTPYSLSSPNIICGGRAFDGDTYKPLELDIEQSRPDVQLYNKLYDEIVTTKSIKTHFSTMRRAEHVRLSLDGKTIWSGWEKQLRRDRNVYGIIFHDYDLGAIEGSYNLIKDNIEEIIPVYNGARIGMKFPTQVNSQDELLRWLALKPLNQYFYLQLNGYLTVDYADELKALQKGSSAREQTVINITGNMTYEEFITTGIIQIYQHLLDLRRREVIFPLTYDKDFFIDKRWEEVIKLISRHNHYILNNKSPDYFQRVAPYDTLFNFARRLTKDRVLYKSVVPVDTMRGIFQFVRENNYELFKMFYEYTGEL